MESLAFYILMIGAWIGVGVVGMYGLLILGRMLNSYLLKKHGARWFVYGTGILGVALLIVGYCLPGVYSEWFTALGALLTVLVAVILINYKGRFKATKSL